jgi:hypothetical protein
MFNFRPSPRGFGFNVKVPEEEVPGFRMNADGTVRDTPPRDVSTAFPGIDPDDSAALPGGIMFNVRPERYLPGLHNFRPPEEEVPGFRMNADGSIRDASAPLQVNPHVGDNPFGAFDRLGTNAFFPVGDGSPPPYPAHVPGLFNGLGRMPTLDKDEPAGTAVSPLSNSPSFPASGSDAMPPVTQPSPFLIGRLDTGDGPRPPSASLGYTANPSSTSEQHLPLPPFAGPVLSGGRSTMGPNTAGDTLPGALAAPDGPPTVSARTIQISFELLMASPQ